MEAFRQALLSEPRDRDTVLREVAEMRARILAAKGGGGPWEAKLGPGRMQDIDLLAQAAALISGRPVRQTPRALRGADWLASAPLVAAYELAWALQIGARLVSEKALDPEVLGQGGCAFLLRLTGFADMAALEAALDARATAATVEIDRVLKEAAV